MKEFFENNVEWLSGVLKKGSIIALICLALSWLFNKARFWIFLPLMLAYILERIFNIPTMLIYVSWLFVFGFLTTIRTVFFEK